MTPQRIAIARALGELDGHVTAETVFGHVSAQMPGVSLPTVYAGLELLQQLGLIAASPPRAAPSSGTRAWPSTTTRSAARAGSSSTSTRQWTATRSWPHAQAAGFVVDDGQLVVRGL